MVKIPNLDDLKKMGSDLLDSAKAVKLGEVVDKFKAGMESAGIKKTTAESGPMDDELRLAIMHLQSAMQELLVAEKAEMDARKKLQTQIAYLEKIVDNYQKIPEPVAEKEDTKEP